MSDFPRDLFLELNDISEKVEDALMVFNYLLQYGYVLDADVLNAGKFLAQAHSRVYKQLKNFESQKVVGDVTSELLAERKIANEEIEKISNNIDERVSNHNLHIAAISNGKDS